MRPGRKWRRCPRRGGKTWLPPPSATHPRVFPPDGCGREIFPLGATFSQRSAMLHGHWGETRAKPVDSRKLRWPNVRGRDRPGFPLILGDEARSIRLGRMRRARVARSIRLGRMRRERNLMAKDTEKLIRQLSLISFLMAERRPVSALEIKQ